MGLQVVFATTQVGMEIRAAIPGIRLSEVPAAGAVATFGFAPKDA